MKRFALYTLALAAALPLWPVTAASPTPPPPSLGTVGSSGNNIPINFTIVPGKFIVSKHNGPVQRYFLYNVAPGQSVSDIAAIGNTSNTTLTVRLTTSDALTPPQGGGIAFNKGSNQRTIGRWLAVNAGNTSISIPSKSYALVGLTLRVPSSVVPGQYIGAINGINARIAKIKRGQHTFNISGVVSCLVFLRVQGRASAGLKIGTVAIGHLSGHTLLMMHLQNTGTLIDQPIVTLRFVGGGLTRPIVASAALSEILGMSATTEQLSIERFIHTAGTYQVHIDIANQVRLSETAPPTVTHLSWDGPLVVPGG